MGQLNVTVDDKLEQKFRAQAAAEYGYKKGNLKKAMESAMTTWMAQKE